MSRANDERIAAAELALDVARRKLAKAQTDDDEASARASIAQAEAELDAERAAPDEPEQEHSGQHVTVHPDVATGSGEAGAL